MKLTHKACPSTSQPFRRNPPRQPKKRKSPPEHARAMRMGQIPTRPNPPPRLKVMQPTMKWRMNWWASMPMPMMPPQKSNPPNPLLRH